jgi:hypothetical protein
MDWPLDSGAGTSLPLHEIGVLFSCEHTWFSAVNTHEVDLRGALIVVV